MRRSLWSFASVVLLACSAPSPEPASPIESATSEPTVHSFVAPRESASPQASLPIPSPTNAVATATPVSSAPSAKPPALDLACKRDADCVITEDTVTGPEACCSGCVWHPANKTSMTAFGNFCKANPPPECPPIGCAMEIDEPKCVSGQCVAAKKRQP